MSPVASTERPGIRIARSANGEEPRLPRTRPSRSPVTATSSSASMATTSPATEPEGTRVTVPSTAGWRATVLTADGSSMSLSR